MFQGFLEFLLFGFEGGGKLGNDGVLDVDGLVFFLDKRLPVEVGVGESLNDKLGFGEFLPQHLDDLLLLFQLSAAFLHLGC